MTGEDIVDDDEEDDDDVEDEEEGKEELAPEWLGVEDALAQGLVAAE